MSEPLLDAIEINPARSATATIIWLHGLGADGHDFESLVPQLGIVEELAVRVVLPHAPRLPVTINGGMVMPAWYDITGPDFGQRQDADGIRASARRLAALIDRETDRGISAQRIVLAGFSQGGAIVLHAGLRHGERLGGILALSTYLPLAESLPDERSAANRDIPIMQAHGQDDPVVPVRLALASRDRLQALGYRVDWRTYPMPHAVCPAEVVDIRDWLTTVLCD
ncbi:MAG: alpha/beta hydrolase-fold protein [Gammaproteobacteria bacterium]